MLHVIDYKALTEFAVSFKLTQMWLGINQTRIPQRS